MAIVERSVAALAHRRVCWIRLGDGARRVRLDCGHTFERPVDEALEVGAEVDCPDCPRCPCCNAYGVAEGQLHRPPGG